MKLTIDNLDRAGARDYTDAIDREVPPRLRRLLNAPPALRIQLRIHDPQLPVPVERARVRLTGATDAVIFTGYLTEQPGYEYLGWGANGPVYRLSLVATGDECLLNRKALQPRPAFVSRSAGDVLRQITSELLPGIFDATQVEDLDTVGDYAAERRKTWSEHASVLAVLGRASYRVEDGVVLFDTIGRTTHQLNESASSFSPTALKIRGVGPKLNDITVLGPGEPAAYVTDYFLADGASVTFTPSQTPFERPLLVLLDEQYQSSTLDPTKWRVADPALVVTAGGAVLNINGGTGVDGETSVCFAEKVECGGCLTLRHGTVTFASNSQGVIGGLYAGSIRRANCLAGFAITAGDVQPNIRALINGVEVGTSMPAVAGHSYTLQTRLYCTDPYRRQQTYHSSVHPAGSGQGGADVQADVRVVLEVGDFDPANPGSADAPPTLIYDDVLLNAPAFVTYGLVNAGSLRCGISQTQLTRSLDAELRSAIPGEDFHTLTLASLARHGEADLAPGPELRFSDRHLPRSQERITLRYRNSAQAMARMVDTASVASLDSPDDDGVRAGVETLTTPAPLTTADCENAAQTILNDGIQRGYSGEYTTSSDFLPSGDVHPGDAIAIDVPSRSAHFTAIVREVVIETTNPAVDRSNYTIRFANEAAEPLAFRAGAVRGLEPLDVPAAAAGAAPHFIEPLTKAEIVSFGTGVVTIDVGAPPPSGGGIELRRSDSGWGPADSANLIERFTTQQFTVPRVSRIADYYLRAYDASSPRRYSRYTTILHVNYPL